MVVAQRDMRFELQREPGQDVGLAAVFARRQKADDADAVLAAVLIQQLAVPLVHLDVFVQILEDDHRKLALIQVGQQRETLAANFHFEPFGG